MWQASIQTFHSPPRFLCLELQRQPFPLVTPDPLKPPP